MRANNGKGASPQPFDQTARGVQFGAEMNNVSERAIRALIGARKNWGGNRTPRGARAQAVLTSILATAKQQGKNAIDLLVELLCSSDPSKILDIVPPIQLPKSDSSPAPPDLSSALVLSSGTNYAHTA